MNDAFLTGFYCTSDCFYQILRILKISRIFRWTGGFVFSSVRFELCIFVYPNRFSMRLISAENTQLKYGDRKRGMKRIAVWSGGGSNVSYMWASDSLLTGCSDKWLDDCLISSTSRRHIALGVLRCVTSELKYPLTAQPRPTEKSLYWLLIMSYFLLYFLYRLLDDVCLVTRLRSEWFLAATKRPDWLWAFAASYSVGTLCSFPAIKADGTWSRLTIPTSMMISNECTCKSIPS